MGVNKYDKSENVHKESCEIENVKVTGVGKVGTILESIGHKLFFLDPIQILTK